MVATVWSRHWITLGMLVHTVGGNLESHTAPISFGAASGDPSPPRAALGGMVGAESGNRIRE